MGGIKPGRRQVKVLHLEPSRFGATFGSAFMVLLASGIVVAAFLYQSGNWPQQWRAPEGFPSQAPIIAAAIGAFLALVFFISAVVNGRRWHIARVVERMSRDPRLVSLMPDTAWTPAPQQAADIPSLDVVIQRARKLPKPQARLRPVGTEHNVIGDWPLDIVYLRLFENQPRIRTFMQGAWREFGYVHLLRSATSVTPAEYRRAKRSGDFSSMFIANRDQLLTALNDSGVHKKGRCRLESIGPTTIKTRDRYGSYSVGALLCHGTFWKAAVDELLERMDLVALDLSGFLPENLGTHYELQRVIDRFPIEGVVFLADEQSNAKFITEQLQTSWSHMAAGSPNAGRDPKTALVVVTDSFVHDRQTTVQSIPGAPGQPAMQQTQTHEVRVRLVARRGDTRRAAAMAQSRLGHRVAMGVATPDRRAGRPGVR